MVDNMLITIYASPMCMLTSFLFDEILLPRHMIRSTNSLGLSFNEEIAPSW